jgi:hypothetical protein
MSITNPASVSSREFICGSWLHFLDSCKQIRRRFPVGKFYLIYDN